MEGSPWLLVFYVLWHILVHRQACIFENGGFPPPVLKIMESTLGKFSIFTHMKKKTNSCEVLSNAAQSTGGAIRSMQKVELAMQTLAQVWLHLPLQTLWMEFLKIFILELTQNLRFQFACFQKAETHRNTCFQKHPPTQGQGLSLFILFPL